MPRGHWRRVYDGDRQHTGGPVPAMISEPELNTGSRAAVAAGRRFRVLVVSRNYPNSVLPLLGLWVDGMVRLSSPFCDIKVISPVPYCPPLPRMPENFARFRRIERSRWDGGVEVFHPRMVIPPRTWFHGFEGFPYYGSVSRLADRIRSRFNFDLIHAHFTFPDGWVAARLSRRYGVPLVITEQASWRPWMDDYAAVRRRALWAHRHCSVHIAISRANRESIVHFTGESPKLRVLPDAVDESVFVLPPDGAPRIADQILFVGVTRPVKGVDILLRAMKLLADRGNGARLVLVGEGFYANYRMEYERLQRMAHELAIADRVEFAGGKPLPELVRYMQQSAALVLPSRRESFGMVLAEALACGTPVVSTRCGGPEDIVASDVGVLVPPEDPLALADGIERVLSSGQRYQPRRLREHAVENFGFASVATRLAVLYQEAAHSVRS